MKKSNLKILFYSLLAFTITVRAMDIAATENELSGTIISVKGNPELIRNDKKIPLTLRTIVHQEDVIITGVGESLVLRLNTGDTVVISQLSHLKVDITDDMSVNLSHDQGMIWARVKARKFLQDKEMFKVRTPTALAGVRGTAFSSNIESDNKSWFCVCEGRLEVSQDESRTTAQKGEVVVAAEKGGVTAPTRDAALLEHPSQFTKSCLRCHQGGYSRDSMY
ncbi:MAG: FecR family protein [bacterium]